MTDLEQSRLKVVRDHMALEITHEWDAVIDTFEHPRYELYGNGTVFDGEEAVRKYFVMSRTPFPDQANEVIAIGAAGEHVVLVEFWLTGTHLGPLIIGERVIEPTGKAFRVRMAASFEFAPGTDRIAVHARLAALSRIVELYILRVSPQLRFRHLFELLARQNHPSRILNVRSARSKAM